MAKKKKKKEDTKELTVIDLNEVSTEFSEVAIYAEKKQDIIIEHNLNVVAGKVQALKNKYGSLVVTDGNYALCESVKRLIVSLRTATEAKRKETLKANFDVEKEALNASFNTILNDIASFEEHFDKQFGVYEDEKKAALTEALNDYKAEVQERYNLREKFLNKVELKKQYFNKTQKETASRDDIVVQFDEQKQAQEEEDAAIKLITDEAGGDARINTKFFIEQLEYRSLSVILSDLKNETARLASLDAGNPQETVVVGVPLTDATKKLIAGRKSKQKKVTVVLTYPETASGYVKETMESMKPLVEYEIIQAE